MNRSIRAYRAAARCDEAAANCDIATLQHLGTKAADLAEMAKRYRRNADAWRKIAAEEGAKERARRVRCWCGRTVSSNGVECAEHDDAPALV